MRTAFKVVKKDSFLSYIQRQAAVQYKPGTTVEPMPYCGPLCCFGTLEQAVDFLFRNAGFEVEEHYQILRCEVVVSDETKIWTETGMELHRYGLPPGTLLCSRVHVLSDQSLYLSPFQMLGYEGRDDYKKHVGYRVFRDDKNTPAMKPAYKLVVKGSRDSYCGQGRFGVKYLPGTTVVPRPNCGPLCCFETIAQALDFLAEQHAGDSENYELLPVAVSVSKENSIWTPDDSYSIGRITFDISTLPPGTILCDSVSVPLYSISHLNPYEAAGYSGRDAWIRRNEVGSQGSKPKAETASIVVTKKEEPKMQKYITVKRDVQISIPIPSNFVTVGGAQVSVGDLDDVTIEAILTQYRTNFLINVAEKRKGRKAREEEEF